jgi:hypothetical protein
MTDTTNAQNPFWLTYGGTITGSLSLGVLQANPQLSSFWINYQSPYISKHAPQGRVGFSEPLRTAVTNLLGNRPRSSDVVLGPPGTNYTPYELGVLGREATAATYRAKGYSVREEVVTQGGMRRVDVVARKPGLLAARRSISNRRSDTPLLACAKRVN